MEAPATTGGGNVFENKYFNLINLNIDIKTSNILFITGRDRCLRKSIASLCKLFRC